jgi:hypothetical protein
MKIPGGRETGVSLRAQGIESAAKHGPSSTPSGLHMNEQLFQLSKSQSPPSGGNGFCLLPWGKGL